MYAALGQVLEKKKNIHNHGMLGVAGKRKLTLALVTQLVIESAISMMYRNFIFEHTRLLLF